MFQSLARMEAERIDQNAVSLTQALVDASKPEFEKMTDMILKKGKNPNDRVPIKSVDAWSKRLQSFTVAELRNLLDYLESVQPVVSDSVSQVSAAPTATDPASQPSSSTDLDRVERGSTVSAASQRSRKSDAKSQTSKRKQPVDDDAVSVSSFASGASRSKKAKSQVSSVAPSMAKPLDQIREDDQMTTISCGSTAAVFKQVECVGSHEDDSKSTISVMSLSEANLKEMSETETEDDIKKWFDRELANLQQRELRDEQFKRKRAMLRVEYWTKMDRRRNNAEPTVINA